MSYQYQLIILGNRANYQDTIVNSVQARVEELGIAWSSFIVLDSANFRTSYKANCPAFCLYFGNPNGNFDDIDEVETLRADGTLIAPIYYTEDEFRSQIPQILSNHNGFLYDNDNKTENLTSLILEGFGLLRNSRKLFISYKRNESRSVAIQLFEEFERNGFDVFLDTHSIRPGEPFQEELWHRMTDCDVIVVLNTPDFLDSQWCKEEIAEANCKLIGIVQLVWPNHALEDMAKLCLPINLSEDDFINGQYADATKSLLTDSIVTEITAKVESVRARNLASRQDSIIAEFTSVAKKLNINVTLQPERYINQTLGNKKERIFIPTVGIPQSFDCNRAQVLIDELQRHKVDSIHLLYDHIRVRDKWLNHLDWLNSFLHVKTLKVENIESWLSNN